MSANIIPNGMQTTMMSGLLYAMKGECDCPSCIALKDMADQLIKTGSTASTARKVKKAFRGPATRQQ